MAPLCAIAIVMGVFPSFFLAPMEPSVRKVVERVQAVRPVRVELPKPLPSVVVVRAEQP